MKWLAIINPSSGGGRSSFHISQLLRGLRRFDTEFLETERPGHAEQIARDSSNYDVLAVMGGDGTLLEVLNGMNCQRQRLAIIPAGTGNSLARDLGLFSIRDGVAAIEEGELIRIDLMSATFQKSDGLMCERLSASTISLGYPAAATKTANRRLKGLGKFCYPAAAVIETLFQKQFPARLAYDRGVPEAKSLTGLILSNTRYVGNFLAFPKASLQDGSFDVMELNADFWRQTFHNLAVLAKRYSYLPTLPKNAASLLFRLETPQELMIDGEIYPDIVHAEVRVSPKQLTCYRKGRAVS